MTERRDPPILDSETLRPLDPKVVNDVNAAADSNVEAFIRQFRGFFRFLEFVNRKLR